MDPLLPTETQLLADIEALRHQFPQTQDLYREVCTVLFFRYGITPTANKLYQFVKKGSMSAPAEALAQFWDNLRDKSRVRIEHPDLPEEIKTSAGELAAALWDLAQDQAKASLQGYEEEARASVAEARTAQAQAETQRDASQAELEQARAELAQAKEDISTLQQQLAAEAATREMLDQQLKQAQADIAAHRQAQESARQYFAAEMEKLRSEAQLAEERYRAAEKRALLDMDRERATASRLQKELEAVRNEAGKALEQYRLENRSLQQQLGDVRQQVGMLEGQLTAAKASGEQVMRELQSAQKQNTESAMRSAGLEVERDGWRLRAEEAEQVARALKEQAVKRGASRKNRITPVEP